MIVSTIEERALVLPAQERASLIERLLKNLDALSEQEAETEAAERRTWSA